MSSPIRGFLWLLSDEDEPSDAAREVVPRPGDPANLRLVRDEEVTGDPGFPQRAPEGRVIFDRMQDLFGTDGSSRPEEDGDVWRRMGLAVILAIAVGILVSLGAAVAFSGL